jgi:HEAT repeat protein
MRVSCFQVAKVAVISGGLILIGWQVYRAPFFREFLATQSPKLGSWGVSFLREALQDDDTHVRMAAAEALKQFGSDAVPRLIEDLLSTDAQIRADALQALTILGEEGRSASPLLIGRFRESDSASRTGILALLASFRERSESIKQLLLDALADEDVAVRASAAETIGALYSANPDADLVDALVRHLGDANPAVQEAVRESLERIGARREVVIAALTKAARDPKSPAAKHATDFLKSLETK